MKIAGSKKVVEYILYTMDQNTYCRFSYKIKGWRSVVKTDKTAVFAWNDRKYVYVSNVRIYMSINCMSMRVCVSVKFALIHVLFIIEKMYFFSMKLCQFAKHIL